jgi:hypothetical protein
VEQNKAAIELVRKLGLDMYAGLITMDPYVNVSELAQNVEFAKEMKLSGTLETSPLTTAKKLVLFGGVPLTEQIRKDGLLREKKFNRYYVFKDPAFRLVYNTALVLSSPMALLNRIRGMVGFRNKGVASGVSSESHVKPDNGA